MRRCYRAASCKAILVLARFGAARRRHMGDFRSFKIAVRVAAEPMKPVIDPAGWTAAELQDVDSWSYAITDRDVEDIVAAVEAVRRSAIPLVEVSRDNFPLGDFAETLAD